MVLKYLTFGTKKGSYTSRRRSRERRGKWSEDKDVAESGLEHQTKRQHNQVPAYVSIRQHSSAYVSIHRHTSAYVSIRQHTPAYVSIREHDGGLA